MSRAAPCDTHNELLENKRLKCAAMNVRAQVVNTAKLKAQ